MEKIYTRIITRHDVMKNIWHRFNVARLMVFCYISVFRGMFTPDMKFFKTFDARAFVTMEELRGVCAKSERETRISRTSMANINEYVRLMVVGECHFWRNIHVRVAYAPARILDVANI